MNLQQTLCRASRKTKLYLRKSSPTILCCVAAVGVVSTAITAAMATPKALRKLKWEKEEKGELSKIETFFVMAPAYIPTAAIGAGTIICIFGANILNKKQQATLLSAYSLLDQSYKEYKAKVIEMLGEDAEREIETAIEKDRLTKTKLDCTNELPLFYDTFGKRYFNRSMEEVKDAEMCLNRNYAIRGYAGLNEYYSYLGLDLTDLGEVMGWEADTMTNFYGANWIDIYYDLVKTDDDLECYVIRFVQEPTLDEDIGNPDIFRDVVKEIPQSDETGYYYAK